MDSAWSQVLPVSHRRACLRARGPARRKRLHRSICRGLRVWRARRRTDEEERYLVDQLGQLTNGVTFIVFGAVIVGPVLADLTWRAALYGVLSLTVVRMVPVAISLLGTHASRPTVAFVGWFGPRGLASIVFTIIVLEDGGLPHISTITVAVVFTIVLSVYAHGLSAKPLTDRYVNWYQAHPRDRRPRMESVPAPPQRWRRPLTAPVPQTPRPLE